jgi:hypothetical protein
MSKLLLFAFLLTLASCELFSTRTPQPPDLGNTFIWTPASDPNTLMNNFTGTIKVLDATNHRRCFLGVNDTLVSGDKLTYTFTPRTGLDATTQALFQQWNAVSEEAYMIKLRAALLTNARLSIQLTNLTINQQNTYSAEISADYVVTIPVTGSSSLPSTISGSLVMSAQLITTEQATKEWRLVAWTDIAASGSTAKTFTDLKALMSL